MRSKSILLLVTVLFSVGYAKEGTWTTLDYPGAAHTDIWGIDGNNLVGGYWDASAYHGFLFNGTSWTTLDMPGAEHTAIFDISGSNLVGWYEDGSSHHGFLYNGTTWITLDMPGARDTYICSIDRNNLVGWYVDASGAHGFLYDGTNWTTLDMPEATLTEIRGMDGSNLVGDYWHNGGHGFLYNGVNWTTLDKPGASDTYIYGISGNNLVGCYMTHYPTGPYHGFLYNGTSWTTLDMPGAIHTSINDIDGSNLVGRYVDASGTHGFLYTVPEPATLLVQTEPNDINTVTPSVGQHTCSGWVDVNASRFVDCPKVYCFDHWVGDVEDANSANTRVFMNSDKTITAVFVEARKCGDECHPYPIGDFDKDCVVTFGDFALFASHWLDCTKPECD